LNKINKKLLFPESVVYVAIISQAQRRNTTLEYNNIK